MGGVFLAWYDGARSATYFHKTLWRRFAARALDLALSAEGSITGTVKVLMNGPFALSRRQLGLRLDIDQVKERFAADMRSILPQGISTSVEKIEGLDTSNGYLSATLRVSGR